jgi:hypothetical protein
MNEKKPCASLITAISEWIRSRCRYAREGEVDAKWKPDRVKTVAM